MGRDGRRETESGLHVLQLVDLDHLVVPADGEEAAARRNTCTAYPDARDVLTLRYGIREVAVPEQHAAIDVERQELLLAVQALRHGSDGAAAHQAALHAPLAVDVKGHGRAVHGAGVDELRIGVVHEQRGDTLGMLGELGKDASRLDIPHANAAIGGARTNVAHAGTGVCAQGCDLTSVGVGDLEGWPAGLGIVRAHEAIIPARDEDAALRPHDAPRRRSLGSTDANAAAVATEIPDAKHAVHARSRDAFRVVSKGDARQLRGLPPLSGDHHGATLHVEADASDGAGKGHHGAVDQPLQVASFQSAETSIASTTEEHRLFFAFRIPDGQRGETPGGHRHRGGENARVQAEHVELSQVAPGEEEARVPGADGVEVASVLAVRHGQQLIRQLPLPSHGMKGDDAVEDLLLDAEGAEVPRMAPAGVHGAESEQVQRSGELLGDGRLSRASVPGVQTSSSVEGHQELVIRRELHA
eukprot:scaffold616_cov257-Pinguiococcus_pyrenoidosus.AAC.14